ncbi:microtubule-associated protein futsch-like [Ptychodera flava]|uniref:microtubule-associated protein futsch-like n=1 Tax=Ptychodera flava TaxID=63121 RepID=UPI00396A7FD3
MDFAYIFGGARTTKKPSTLRRKHEEPVAKYIDKSRAIAIARQLKITRIGKVTLRINSKNSIDSELPKVPLTDTRMTTRKAILEKRKGLNTAMHTKDSAVGKCILKANDYQERQLRRYVSDTQENKERTYNNMKEKKRAFVSKQRNFNQEPITSVEDELEYVQQLRRRHFGSPGAIELQTNPTASTAHKPAEVYRSAFNYSIRRQSSSMTSGVFLTTPGFGQRGSRAVDRGGDGSDGQGRRSREESITRSGKATRENTMTSMKSAIPSRPSTRGQMSESDAEEQDQSRDEDRRRKSTKRVSILEDKKSQEKKPPSRRRRSKRHSSVVSLIPKRSPTPTRVAEIKSLGGKLRAISPIDELPSLAEYDGNATDDERFTALEDLLIPESNQEAQLIASDYAKQFAYKAQYSHRRPKQMPTVKNEENVKKFENFLESKKLRKSSSRSTASL